MPVLRALPHILWQRTSRRQRVRNNPSVWFIKPQFLTKLCIGDLHKFYFKSVSDSYNPYIHEYMWEHIRNTTFTVIIRNGNLYLERYCSYTGGLSMFLKNEWLYNIQGIGLIPHKVVLGPILTDILCSFAPTVVMSVWEQQSLLNLLLKSNTLN
jgi:hypothetical protein